MTPLEFDLQESGDPLMPVQLIAILEGLRTATRGVQLVVGFRPSLGVRVASEKIPAGVSDFEALAVEEQEKVIGRTRQASTQLAEGVCGAHSHVSRTVIEENRGEQHIFCRNTPVGTATEPYPFVKISDLVFHCHLFFYFYFK